MYFKNIGLYFAYLLLRVVARGKQARMVMNPKRHAMHV